MSEHLRQRQLKDADGTRQKLSYPDLPEPLLVGTYDNHTHLEIADGDQPMNYQDHLALANQVGILGAVQVGVTLESSKWSAEVAATEPRLLAAVAIHPNEAARYESMQALDVDIDGIADLASQERVRAIGETGLDFFRTESDQGKSRASSGDSSEIGRSRESCVSLLFGRYPTCENLCRARLVHILCWKHNHQKKSTPSRFF